MLFKFHNTHAYPGCPATVLEGRKASNEGKAVIEFSDGSVTAGRYKKAGPDEIVLKVEKYITARRTPIPAKRWTLARTPAGAGWKVSAKRR